MANAKNALVPVAELLSAAIFAALAVFALAWAAPSDPHDCGPASNTSVVSDRSAAPMPSIHEWVRSNAVR